MIFGPRDDHGTRACYCAGCRCSDCRAANTERYRQRRRAIAELVAEVEPSGPPIPSTLQRGGHTAHVLLCPGANGARCVRGGTWLKGRRVCMPCVERATIWDGLVSAAAVKRHLLKLRRRGVGYKAVADACDVANMVLSDVLAGRKKRIRASTERAVLEVDANAIADHALVDAAPTRALFEELRERGFTLRHLDELLGGAGVPRYRGEREHVLAKTALQVEQLWRQVQRGEIAPERAFVDVTAEVASLRALLDAGVTAKWLSARTGVHLQASSLRNRMRPERAAKITAFLAEVEQIRREGWGSPDEWWQRDGGLVGLSKGFGHAGGYLMRSGASPGSKPRKTRAKKPAPRRTLAELLEETRL